MNNTLTLASIYESQGHKRDALEIYWKILEDDPENKAAKKALERLGKGRRVFLNIYKDKTDFFVNMRKKEEFYSFEKWLVEKWS